MAKRKARVRVKGEGATEGPITSRERGKSENTGTCAGAGKEPCPQGLPGVGDREPCNGGLREFRGSFLQKTPMVISPIPIVLVLFMLLVFTVILS